MYFEGYIKPLVVHFVICTLSLNLREKTLCLEFLKYFPCLSQFLAELSGDQESLNLWLGGVSYPNSEIKGPKLVISGVSYLITQLSTIQSHLKNT